MNIYYIKYAEPQLQVPLENYKFLSNFKSIIIIIILSKVPFHTKLVYQTIMYLCYNKFTYYFASAVSIFPSI